MPVVIERDTPRTLADLVDRILDKGVVINADIAVSVAGVELLGIKLRAALASFETAARYGLEFPSGTNFAAEGWKESAAHREPCPDCGRRESRDLLLASGCPWCGWTPPQQTPHGALRPVASGGELASRALRAEGVYGA